MLKDKCVLITGGAGGIGLAAANRFAAAGCHIALNDIVEAEKGVKLCAEIAKAHGVRVLYLRGDVGNVDEIERMFAETVRAFGGVDILVNNAVVRHIAPVEEFPVEAWDKGIAVNLSSAFHTIRLALPGMRKKDWGRIINVSSVYGLNGTANRINYITTKTGLIGITRAVAVETAEQNITCNALCPGTVFTPPHETKLRQMVATDGISYEEAEKRFLKTKQPTGRWVLAEDVADFMAFLCGPSSRDITGAVLPMDGGWTTV
jgi:3-hydroxybutyrate dehydrogenase